MDFLKVSRQLCAHPPSVKAIQEDDLCYVVSATSGLLLMHGSRSLFLSL